jgi:nicotinate-nucleotide pyrophosphorylase (carboxylating)
MTENKILHDFIVHALHEDVGEGDHSSLASVSPTVKGKARLIIKEEGIVAGIRIAREVFSVTDSGLKFSQILTDGTRVAPGDIAFTVAGNSISILKAERLVLNIMQRMSGIATRTAEYSRKISGLKAKVLDTRKTTPGMRFLEKEAVRLGGGENHRMGLYDMIMLKDNHVDFAGGIEKAIDKTNEYLKSKNLNLRIEIEARSLSEVERIIKNGGVNRIMLDNFTVEETRKAVELIAGKFETESSGGITLDTIRDYALCGVDYISVGALTHHIKSLDMSLKAVK